MRTDEFEQHRPRLRAIATRMLGSTSDADDAVQEAYLRLHRSQDEAIDNIGGWLTTVVARVCLDVLRARKSKREELIPDPIVAALDDNDDAEQRVLLADAVSVALLVVLDTLPPAERLAFMLHDMFAMPFEEVAPIVGKSVEATRQLASRARKRVQGAETTRSGDVKAQRAVVEAFLAAARTGDVAALLAILDPDVVLRSDGGAGRTREVRGADTVIKGAVMGAAQAASRVQRLLLVNGAVGVVSYEADGSPQAIIAFTFEGGRITAMETLADPARVQRLIAHRDQRPSADRTARR